MKELNELVSRLEKAIEYMAYHFRTYGGSSLYGQIMEILNPPDPNKFMECDSCREKPGSPILCKGCIHNRSLIEKLRK